MFRDVSGALSGPGSGASRLEIGCLVGRRVATRYAKSALTKERTNWPLWRPPRSERAVKYKKQLYRVPLNGGYGRASQRGRVRREYEALPTSAAVAGLAG